MARRCIYCEKHPVVGHKISHSNIKTKIRHYPNLQKMRVLIDGTPTRAYVCTRCIRSGWIAKPLVGPARKAREQARSASKTAPIVPAVPEAAPEVAAAN